MVQRLFIACKWLAIILCLPSIILAILNLVNAIWLDNIWGNTLTVGSDFCFKVLGTSFLVSMIIAITDKNNA